jgi:hypothetical protein
VIFFVFLLFVSSPILTSQKMWPSLDYTGIFRSYVGAIEVLNYVTLTGIIYMSLNTLWYLEKLRLLSS